MADKSMILGEWRLEDKDRRLENASLKKAELLERLEAKKGRLDRAEKGKEKFQAKMNMKMLLESVLDMVIQDGNENIQNVCHSITKEVVEQNLAVGDRR